MLPKIPPMSASHQTVNICVPNQMSGTASFKSARTPYLTTDSGKTLMVSYKGTAPSGLELEFALMPFICSYRYAIFIHCRQLVLVSVFRTKRGLGRALLTSQI